VTAFNLHLLATVTFQFAAYPSAVPIGLYVYSTADLYEGSILQLEFS